METHPFPQHLHFTLFHQILQGVYLSFHLLFLLLNTLTYDFLSHIPFAPSNEVLCIELHIYIPQLFLAVEVLSSVDVIFCTWIMGFIIVDSRISVKYKLIKN
jgi:hypothetical protein